MEHQIKKTRVARGYLHWYLLLILAFEVFIPIQTLKAFIIIIIIAIIKAIIAN